MRPRFRFVLVIGALSVMPSSSLHAALAQASFNEADAPGFAVDLRLGAALGSTNVGSSLGVGDGYFQFREVGAAPQLGLGLTFPEIGLGIRPQAIVSYAMPASAGGVWIPCDPGLACIAILPPAVDGRASRLEASAGFEVPILRSAGPARPYAAVGVGVRRYGFSYDAIGESTDAVRLGAGSFSETDLLFRVAVGAGFQMGAFDALIEGGAGLSRFGAGRVPVPAELLALWTDSTIDLGRESHSDVSVTAGIRRYLD